MGMTTLDTRLRGEGREKGTSGAICRQAEPELLGSMVTTHKKRLKLKQDVFNFKVAAALLSKTHTHTHTQKQ